ncbi:brachyurin-like [Tenebrio molitor]|uniref:brachyurin-like n=1 Tax=Tenebrio molitor TaxID=7067 RepID=UPI0036248224
MTSRTCNKSIKDSKQVYISSKMKHIAIFCLCFVLVWSTPLQKNPLKKVSVKDIDSRIINGDQAGLAQFPWQAALFIGSYFVCSGSIISEEWILTAAQCIDGVGAVTVLAGIVDLNGSGAVVQSSDLIVHKDYDHDNFLNDIGLVQLRSPLTFTRYLAPIALADNLLEDGLDVTISGWGATVSDGDESQFLLYADLVTIRNSECIAIYGNTILDSIVCAESEMATVQNACYGDGGAPLVLDVETDPVHVGLLSFIGGDTCESGYPSGFTRTAAFRIWIRDEAGV